jgi:hypothetical protein
MLHEHCRTVNVPDRGNGKSLAACREGPRFVWGPWQSICLRLRTASQVELLVRSTYVLHKCVLAVGRSRRVRSCFGNNLLRRSHFLRPIQLDDCEKCNGCASKCRQCRGTLRNERQKRLPMSTFACSRTYRQVRGVRPSAIAGAGLYQCSAWRKRSLRVCPSPLHAVRSSSLATTVSRTSRRPSCLDGGTPAY